MFFSSIFCMVLADKRTFQQPADILGDTLPQPFDYRWHPFEVPFDHLSFTGRLVRPSNKVSRKQI